MIVQALKNNIQMSFVFLLILCLGAWGCSFSFESYNNGTLNDITSPLTFLFIKIQNYPILNHFISLTVISLGAFLINYLAIEQEIVSKTNYLPSFIYLLIAFSGNTTISSTPLLTANLFILICFHYLIKIYRQDNVLSECFKGGLFFSIAFFFYIQYLVLLPICLFIIAILRPFNWREWALLVIGIIFPVYLFSCFSYLTSTNAFLLFNEIGIAFSSLHHPIISEYYIIILATISLCSLLMFMHYLNKSLGGKVKTQKTKHILLWLLILTLITVAFNSPFDMILLPAAIPLSILIGDYLADIKQIKIANTLLMLFIVGFIVVFLRAMAII